MDPKKEEILNRILQSEHATLLHPPGVEDFAVRFNSKFGPINVRVDPFLPEDTIVFVDEAYLKSLNHLLVLRRAEK